MSGERVSYGPWHTLRVTATWYCAMPDLTCRDNPGEACEGHDAEAVALELEREYEIEHPADCPIPSCCCTWPEGPSYIDPNCEAGHHETCLNRGCRCYTEDHVCEWGDMYEESKVSGVYRVRVWGSGPDHNGEYDGGIDWERAPLEQPIGAAA